MRRKNWELKGIFWIITLLFVGFLAAPILLLLGKSLVGEGGFTWEFYASVVTREGFLTALGNSFAVAAASAVTATVIAFLMAYAVHYTGLPRWAKRLITAIATLPMFLPTITYGFAIIYSFGKQGLLTRLLGRQFFDIYGFGGLLVGYVIYTIPVAFLLSRVFGPAGVWNAFWIAEAITAAIAFVVYRKALRGASTFQFS